MTEKKVNLEKNAETFKQSLDVLLPGEPCPICHTKVREDYSDSIDYTVCEYRNVCDLCGLTEDYAYGNGSVYIEGFIWVSHYNDKRTPEEEEKERAEKELVLTLYQKIYLEKKELSEEEERSLKELESKMEEIFSCM